MNNQQENIERLKTVVLCNGFNWRTHSASGGYLQLIKEDTIIPLYIEFDGNNDSKKEAGMITTGKAKEFETLEKNDVLSELGWGKFGNSPSRKCIDTQCLSEQNLNNIFRYFHGVF
jgi:hypothetical protein